MGILGLTGVSKGFGGNPVLRDINLSVATGEFLAIVGFSGSGKTTLITLMACILRVPTRNAPWCSSRQVCFRG